MNELTQEITGGCLCGAVRYRACAPPMAVRLCFCRTCQYMAAGNAAVNAVFGSGDVTFTGETREYVITADSGNIMHRRFCPVCGTPVSNQGEAWPDIVIVRVGTLDDPGIVTPASAIWMDSAPRWACLDPGIERIARQSRPPAQPT